MPGFSAWKPDSVTNWNLYPIAPSSLWNEASWLSVRWRFQLNDGEQLYASSLPGYSRRIASENCFASARSGLAVSNHSMSAYGAYARARAIAASTPSLTAKNRSGRRLTGAPAPIVFVGFARQQRGAVRVGARDQNRLDAAHVSGQARRDKLRDEFAGGHEHLAAQMAAPLHGRRLVLERRAGGACADHLLHELVRVQPAAEARLGIGDERHV